MGIKFEGQVLKFGTVDKCNRKFAPDCKITFPEKIPVAYNFDMDEIIGHADISHALNAPTFPNGFEKVKHNGNVYFVERED